MTNLPRGPFRVGDRVQLTGPKGKLHTITLEPGKAFGTHRGELKHDDIIGKAEGSVIRNHNGIEYLALRPLMTDFVMSMPRGANIIYPKDSALIVTMGDIFPGARVIEAGVGSGGLSMYLLRAIGPTGRHDPENWQIHIGDLQDALPKVCADGDADRVVLDMLAPWECVEESAAALIPGGLIVGYVATVTQLSRFTEALRNSGHFAEPEAFETLFRGWHLQGLAVRPEHRMIGHTGFLVTARRLAPDTVVPKFKGKTKPEFADEDIAVWNPDHMGERKVSDKKLRKTVRNAQKTAEARLDQERE
jgi:tRNA (adenine57-N1/adenine58-N1)-methyltransferase